MENESIDSLPFSPLPSPTINKLHELRVKAAEEALAQSLFNLSKNKKNEDEKAAEEALAQILFNLSKNKKNEDEYWNNYYSDSFELLSSDYYDRKYKDDSDSFESLSSDEGNQYTSLSSISPDDWNKIEMYKNRNKPKPPTNQNRRRGKFVRAAQYLDKRGRPVNEKGDPVKREEFSNIGGSSSKKTKTKKIRTKKSRTKKSRTKKSRTKKTRTKKQSRTKRKSRTKKTRTKK